LLVLAFLYIFLVGVSMLEAGIKSFGAGFQDVLLSNVDHPIAGLSAGILATVLVQSSSVSTATIVGLVGAGTLTVDAAVPMIMGANIGTTVTNTLVALGSASRSDEFRRAFAGATMHDFFNLIAVAIFLPLQITTNFLSDAATEIADLLGGNVAGSDTKSPIKKIVKEPVGWITDAIESVTDSADVVGALLIVLGIVFIFAALAFITRNMRSLIASRIEKALNSLVARGGGLVGMVFGILVTVSVQSSSITTSILVPMVGSGVLSIRNAYPITLGANLGTTVTALLASLAVDLRAGLVVALTHTLFNVAAIVTIYPIPRLRYVPVDLAERLADLAVANRAIVAVYVGGMFVLVPLIGILAFR
jgi:sodium-dependent phosphate cotransporter